VPEHSSGSGLVGRDAAVFLSQRGSSPVRRAVVGCDGPYLIDADGGRILDFHGNGSHHLGYGHPAVLAALRRQLDVQPFSPRRFTNEAAVALAERLVALWPYGPARVLLAPSGTDAIEIALKLAYVATGRRGTLAFEGAWHGAGLGALSVGGRERERAGMPLLEGCRHLPAFWADPTAGRPCPEAAARVALEALERALAVEAPAALVAEPVHSRPGVAADWFWTEVEARCRRAGTLLVFDEIPTGLGKTGHLFASQRHAVTPDVTVLGKALGGAVLPLAAVIARADLDRAGELAIGHITHEKNPVLAAVGLAVLEVIVGGGLVERSRRNGEILAARLSDLRDQGLLSGFEVAGSLAALRVGTGIDPLATEAEAYRRGLNLTADASGRVTLSMPLILDQPQLDAAALALAEALRAAPAVTGSSST